VWLIKNPEPYSSSGGACQVGDTTYLPGTVSGPKIKTVKPTEK